MSKFEFADMLAAMISDYLTINVQPCEGTSELDIKLPNGEIFIVEVRKVR